MGFTATTGSSADTLSGLINLLSDPKKVVAKLEELKSAMADHEVSLQKVQEAQSKLAEDKNALNLQVSVMEKERAALKNARDDLAKEKNGLDEQFAEIHKLKLKANEVLENAHKEKDAILIDLSVKRHGLEDWRKTLEQRNTELDLKERSVNALALEAEKKAQKAEALLAEYNAKLAKLKELV